VNERQTNCLTIDQNATMCAMARKADSTALPRNELRKVVHWLVVQAAETGAKLLAAAKG